MDEHASRLDELRIDKDAKEIREGKSWLRPITAGGIALLVLGLFFWFNNGPDETPVDQAAAAKAPDITNADAAIPITSGAGAFDAAGYVVARRQATVSSKVAGRLAEVLIEEGQHVEKGDILARLDDSNATAALQRASAQVAQARANLEAANVALSDYESTYQRYQDLAARGAWSTQEAENARANYNARRMAVAVSQKALTVQASILGIARQDLDDTLIRAPFSGIVTEKAAEPGEIVSPGSTGGFTRTGICTVVDMESLEVEVDVSENLISRVRSGLPAQIRLNAYPDWEIPGAVLAIIPTADRAKATVKVRVGFNAKDPRIVPEMGVRVSFKYDPSNDKIVPKEGRSDVQ